MSKADVERIFKEMDSDGNGEVSQEEFEAWWSRNLDVIYPVDEFHAEPEPQ